MIHGGCHVKDVFCVFMYSDITVMRVSIGVRNSYFLLTSRFNTGLPSFIEQEM